MRNKQKKKGCILMLEEQIKNHADRVKNLMDKIGTEEATKTSLIMPLFQILGYDVFNPTEFIPEFTADVGVKKGEKVDYAIVLNGEPTILIEAKSVSEKLEKHDSQLFRYFSTTKAKFAILTNGISYRFYTDLDEPNKMDKTPFLDIDLLNLTDGSIAELKKFCKEKFNVENIFSNASDLKYSNAVEKILKDEFANPSDELIRLLLSKGVYDGRCTQSVVEKFKPIIKKSISFYINELVNDKIKNALDLDDKKQEESEANDALESAKIGGDDKNRIITTEEEIASYYIVKAILASSVSPERITYKDTASYFGILLDGKVTKWICRICLKENVKYVLIPHGKDVDRYEIDNVDKIYGLSDFIINRLNELL